jgi:membrane fusion protein (multidrug efflux system)
MKRWWVMIGAVLVIVVVAGGLFGYNLWKTISGFKAMANPKQTVSAMQVAAQPWRDRVQAVGSLHAVRGADLSAEVAGVVDAIHFESGADVKAGAVLIELRAGEDRAKLASLKAAADLAASVQKRNRLQFEAKIISQAQLDTDEATFKGALAQVAEQQALVDKKIIRAPFAGHLGIRAVDEGQFVAVGNKLVTLQDLDPIHVDFSLPQQKLAAIKVGQAVNLTTDIYPDKQFAGKIAAIDPAVNVETRSVQVRATLKNPERKLLPGMFARVDIEVGEQQNHLTLPQTAIAYNPYGETVYVITTAAQLEKEQRAEQTTDAQGTAEAKEQKLDAEAGKQLVAKQVFVTTGAKRGDQVAIIKGIKAGDQVVTSGQLKLRNGAPIVINNKVLPSNNPTPTPQEE